MIHHSLIANSVAAASLDYFDSLVSTASTAFLLDTVTVVDIWAISSIYGTAGYYTVMYLD